VESVSRVISGTFALTGFSVAVAIGLGAANPASIVLLRAIVCLIACMIVGRLVGFAAELVIKEHLDAYRERNPIPDLSTVSQPEGMENPPEGNVKG
jgi:hypothetical protein